LPILTLALFFQKVSICRERSTSVEFHLSAVFAPICHIELAKYLGYEHKKEILHYATLRSE